ncbi:hypothetical protein LTS15_011113 [Exophiala xenobiotica]|nr:hypothetical protein LTS15_011113 [Exophiala xenobiotica]
MPPKFASRILLLFGVYESCVNALTVPFVPPPADVLTAEGIDESPILAAALPTGLAIDRSNWNITCDSVEAGNPCTSAIDSSTNTFWHTEYSPTLSQLPHNITIDMRTTYNVNGIVCLPRQDGSGNGRIGQHKIFVSTDGTNFGSPVAFGTWTDNALSKTAAFEPVPARYIRIQALTEAGNRGPWTSVADINVYAPSPGTAIDRTGWTATCDSAQAGNECVKAITDTSSFWHTQYSPTLARLPHNITIDMKSVYSINSLRYLPRQDGSHNGNIGQYQVYTSTDGTSFASVASGTFKDDTSEKNVVFNTVSARYIQVRALSEAGNRGNWTSAAAFTVYLPASYTPPPTNLGKWGPTINFPLVPVAAAINPTNGRVLTWASYSSSTFVGGSGHTITSTYDPTTLIVSRRDVTQTNHDMFCPGISLDFNGRPIVTGGNNAQKTSIYDPLTDAWIAGSNMKISRGYQSSATCSDGRIFTIGGSWSGGEGGKNGEIYNTTTGNWTLLPGCPVAPMLTADTQGVYRSDNHAWLFGWKNGSVFQAGPSKAMNWYDMAGSGAVSAAGNRASDTDSMCGVAVMYDAVAGNILTAGGSPNYQGTEATGNAHLIKIGNKNSTPLVTTLSSMAYERIFHNSVVLPDGQVFITGGQTVGWPFYDIGADLTPEMWSPLTNTFTQMLPNSIPRNYHSIALLLLDGTVLSGGGGLCADCSSNHFDAQIYTPQYLLNSDGTNRVRPVINSVSTASLRVGQSLTITTGSVVSSASLIRYGSATHTVNTDQRRVPLTLRLTGTNTYSVTVPSDPGVALPGYWMLFVMNAAGTPSVAKTIKVNQ